MRRTSPYLITEVIRLRQQIGLTHGEISLCTGLGRSTISRLLGAAAKSGLEWPLPEGMTKAELREKMFGPRRERQHLQPDLDKITEALRKRGHRKSGVTRRSLWEDYCKEASDKGIKAYGRSQFYNLVRDALRAPGPE